MGSGNYENGEEERVYEQEEWRTKVFYVNVIKAHMNTETELACTGLAGSVPGPSPGTNYGYEFSVFMGVLSV